MHLSVSSLSRGCACRLALTEAERTTCVKGETQHVMSPQRNKITHNPALQITLCCGSFFWAQPRYKGKIRTDDIIRQDGRGERLLSNCTMVSPKLFRREALKDGIRARGHPQCRLVAGSGIALLVLEMWRSHFKNHIDTGHGMAWLLVLRM